jgi:hypothetical protein
MRDLALANIPRELHQNTTAALVDMSMIGMPGTAEVAQGRTSFLGTFSRETNGGQLEIIQCKNGKNDTPQRTLLIWGIYSGMVGEAGNEALIAETFLLDSHPGPHRPQGTLSVAETSRGGFQTAVRRVLRQETAVHNDDEALQAAAIIVTGFRQALQGQMSRQSRRLRSR